MTYTIIAGAKAAGATIAPILESIVALASNGLIVRTSSTTVAARTITGVSGETVVTNGDGVSGNPTIGIGANVVTLTGTQTLTNKTLTSPIVNTPNLTGGTINNASVGATTPSTGVFTTLITTGSLGIGVSPGTTLDINGARLRLRVQSNIPTASAAGNIGEIAWNTGFLYVCIGPNTWRRVAITPW